MEAINNVYSPLTPESGLTILGIFMKIKSLDGERFSVTNARTWKMHWNFRSKINIKNAGLVASHLQAWLFKLHGAVFLPSFDENIKQLALENKCNGSAPLDLEVVDTQAIVGMDIKCLIGCDSISITSNKSDFISVEDDIYIGTFASAFSRVSFSDAPKAFEFDKDSNSNFHKTNQVSLIKCK